MNNCKNCNAEATQNYCPNCGQPVSIKRIDWHYIVHEIEHVLHFERGIIYTIQKLLTDPGQAIRQYISENRSRLVKPLIFIVVTSLMYSLATHFFHIEDGYVVYGGDDTTTTGAIFKWVQEHYGYANIIMGVFITFWIRIFFRKYQYNFFEILILLCFVMGISMLMIAVSAIIQGITHIAIMQFASLLAVVYCSWAIGQFFDKTKIINYLKAFAAYILGMLTFSLFAIGIGMTIDMVFKS